MADYDLGLWNNNSLPIRLADLRRHRRILDREEMSLLDLQESLMSDPAAVQQLYRAAQERIRESSRKHNGRDHQLRTLDQVMQVLGSTQIQQVLRSMPVLKEEGARESRFLALMGQSVLAAWQARRWAILQNHRNYDEVWLAALLYHQTSWHLAWHEDKRLGELAQVLLTPQSPERAERRVFGSTFMQLGRRWVDWQTPMDLLKASFDPAQLPDRSELRRLAHHDFDMIQRFNSRPQVWVVLANQAAAALRFRGSHAWIHLRFISGLFRMDSQRVWDDLVQNALQVARNSSFPGSAAASLLWDQPQTRRRRLTTPWWLTLQDLPPAPAVAEPVVVAAPEPVPAQQVVRREPVEVPPVQIPDDHFLTQFVARLDAMTNLNQQLLHLVQSWYEGIQLSRVALMVFNTERSSLRVLLQRGWAADSSMAALHWSVSDNPLVTSLMRQAGFLLLDEANIERYRVHLSDGLMAHIQLPCMLASIMAGERPLALLLADCAGAIPSARQLQACRLSLPAFHKGVDRLRRQTASQKKSFS